MRHWGDSSEEGPDEFCSHAGVGSGQVTDDQGMNTRNRSDSDDFRQVPDGRLRWNNQNVRGEDATGRGTASSQALGQDKLGMRQGGNTLCLV